MKHSKIFNYKIILLTILSACFLLAGIFCSFTKNFSAKADADMGYNFIPTSLIENTQLSTPIDAIFSQKIVVLQEQGSTQTVLISNGDRFVEITHPSSSFTSLKQVKAFNDSCLISDNGRILQVDFQNDLATLTDITCNEFDVNQNYLVTAFSGNGVVYRVDGNSFTPVGTTISVENNKPICIDQDDVLYYIKGSSLCSISILDHLNGLGESNFITPAHLPEKMVVKGDYIYYVSGNKIYKINKSLTEEEIELTVDNGDKDKPEYTLGKITSPKSISFKGENLFISDASINAVQEFEIVNNNLKFTGYAITNQTKAYNRISKNAVDVEKNLNAVAVLDDFKLTFIENGENFDGKNPEYFYNYLLNDQIFSGKKPVKFALGKDTALIGLEGDTPNEISINDLLLLNYKSGISKTVAVQDNDSAINLDGKIKDITYSAGKYYIITHNATKAQILEIDENYANDVYYSHVTDKDVSNAELIISTDMMNNVYYADSSKIYGFNLVTKTEIPSIDYLNAKKIATDLNGVLYATDGVNLSYLNNGQFTNISINGNVKSFSMSFDTKEVYYLLEDDQTLYVTEQLENYAINSIEKPNDYVLTGATARDTLGFYTVKESSKIYSVLIDENLNFTFNDLVSAENQYIMVTDFTVGELNYFVLAGQDGIVLTLSDNAESFSQVTENITNQTAFITTSVSAYYLPIITMEETYVLQNASGNIRLQAGMSFSPIKLFTAFEKPTYLAKLTVDGAEIFAYIPKDYTVTVLSENVEYLNFTVRNISDAEVYKDSDLTVKLFDTKAQEVRLVKLTETYAEVYINVDGAWVQTFVKPESLVPLLDNTLRNAVILITAITCLSVTFLYFVLRKKRK